MLLRPPWLDHPQESSVWRKPRGCDHLATDAQESSREISVWRRGRMTCKHQGNLLVEDLQPMSEHLGNQIYLLASLDSQVSSCSLDELEIGLAYYVSLNQ